MKRLIVPFVLALSPAAGLATELKCGPHEHIVEERDEDEGSKVKRCVCDEGWDADGPGKPCRAAGATAAPEAGAKAPAKGGAKAGGATRRK